MKHGVYFHIPFCEQRCYYCAFTVAVSPESSHKPYVERLTKEWELARLCGDSDTVYFGGGTPSLLSAEMLAGVLKLVGGAPREISIEINPGTLSAEKVASYREMGINRISLGAQSMEDEDLQRAGRLHRASDVSKDFRLLRDSGFRNINLDLIAGLPNQRFAVWRRNLEQVLELRPEHVSIYMLDREERSAWARGPSGVPDEDGFAEFYREAELQLEAAGYQHYEISNWAQPGYECRHNLGYWEGVPYRGFGVGAHSFFHGRRFWNTDSLNDYAALIDNGKLPISGGEYLTPSIRREEAFMLGLRMSKGIDVVRLAEDLGIKYPPEWYERLEQLQQGGWVDFDGAHLRLTAAGRLAANAVIGELIWPTPSSTFEAIL